MKQIGLVLSVLWLSACASPGSNDTAALEQEHDLVCEYVAKTGSNMKKKTCMKRSLAEELHKESRDDLREAWRMGQTQTSTQ
jgi:hypothetical protein